MGQTVRLSERMRVAHRLSLFLVRPRNSLVSLSSWSGSRTQSPPLQNMFWKVSLFSEIFPLEVGEPNQLNSGTFTADLQKELDYAKINR